MSCITITIVLLKSFTRFCKIVIISSTVKGIDKFEIRFREVLLHEMQSDYKKALQLAKQLPLYSYDVEHKTIMDEMLERIKNKRSILSEAKKTKK